MRTIAEREFNLQLFAEEEGETQAPVQAQEQEAPAQQGGYEGILNLQTAPKGGDDWRAQLPEELKSHPSLQKFNSPADLFKSYVSLESMLGKNKVPIPDENAPQEEWDKFYEKLGRPKTPDEYEIKLDGIQTNEEFLNNYKQWAHKAGLNKQQAAELAKHYAEFENQYVAKLRQDFINRVQEAKRNLANEWGQNYERNVKAAERALMAAANEIDGLQEWLEASGAKADPVFVKLMHFFGRGLAEDTLKGGGRAIAPESAEAEIERLLADDDFKKKYLSGNKAAVEQITRLMEAAYGNKEADSR